MTDLTGAQAPSSGVLQSARGRGKRFGLLLTFQIAASVILFTLILWNPPGDATRAVELLLAAGSLAAILWAAAPRWRISRDLARLEVLLPKVHKGEEPIESLCQIGGRLAALAATCQKMTRDLRQERAGTAQLENELRQRIATRTEALERTIGALRQQAARDALTGLCNRRMLDTYLPEAIERCQRAVSPLSLLMIDIDHFKLLNDSLGHAAGDQMLRSMAQIIRSTLRDTDSAFRSGGDEFVVVLEGCDAPTGRALADRLGSLTDALGRTFRIAPSPRLSIGLTTLAEVPHPTPQSLLQQADQALYRVKVEHHAAVRTRQTA